MMAAMWVFLVLLAVGVGVAVWALLAPRDRGRAASILAERLARGELAPDEYRERLSLIDVGGSNRRSLIPVGVALIVFGLIGAVAAGGIAMGRGDMGWMMRGMPMMDGMMGDMDGMMGGGESGRDADPPREGAPERRVKGSDFRLTPSTIRIPAGETVNIEFENVGASFHTFTVPALDFDLRAQPGDDVSASLRVPEAGRYEAICTVPGHERLGMRGTLVVEER